MTVPTPAQVLEQRRELLLKHDVDGFVDLFAPDAVIELPFAGPGMPPRLAGQQAIRDFSHRTVASPLRIDDLEATAVYHTDDPEVLVTEIVALMREGVSRDVAGGGLFPARRDRPCP